MDPYSTAQTNFPYKGGTEGMPDSPRTVPVRRMTFVLNYLYWEQDIVLHVICDCRRLFRMLPGYNLVLFPDLALQLRA